MATHREFKELVNTVNTMIESAKNVTKVKKALAMANDFLAAHNAKITEYITHQKYFNRLNAMHDLTDKIETLIDGLEWNIERRSWSSYELYQLSTFDAWID